MADKDLYAERIEAARRLWTVMRRDEKFITRLKVAGLEFVRHSPTSGLHDLFLDLVGVPRDQPDKEFDDPEYFCRDEFDDASFHVLQGKAIALTVGDFPDQNKSRVLMDFDDLLGWLRDAAEFWQQAGHPDPLTERADAD